MTAGNQTDHRRVLQVLSIAVVAVTIFATSVAAYLLTRGGVNVKPTNDRLLISIDSGTVRYRILLPVALEENRTPWYLASKLQATVGNPTFSLVDTTNGTMLSVEGDGNVTLAADAAPRGLPYFAVAPQWGSGSLHSLGVIPYVVYANASGSESEIGFSLRASSWDPGAGELITLIAVLRGELREGWQIIWGEASHITP